MNSKEAPFVSKLIIDIFVLNRKIRNDTIIINEIILLLTNRFAQ